MSEARDKIIQRLKADGFGPLEIVLKDSPAESSLWVVVGHNDSMFFVEIGGPATPEFVTKTQTVYTLATFQHLLDAYPFLIRRHAAAPVGTLELRK